MAGVLVCGGLSLAACGESQSQKPPQDALSQETSIETATPAADTPDPNSLQALRDTQTARESLPGKAHYEQACQVCHNGSVTRAPHKDMLGLMTAEAILKALTHGVMQAEASQLSDLQRKELAEYLAGAPLGTAQKDIPACPADLQFDALQSHLANNWGLGLHNTRQITEQQAGISGADLDALQQRWAVRFPGANRARSQPAFAGGLVFVGAHNGLVYALDQHSGCQLWAFQASGEVRTGIVIKPWQPGAETTELYFGDILGNVYAVDARHGQLLWRLRADDHPNATITGTPSLADGTLYIPISSLEVAVAVDPEYACCTFRGSILAVDAASGEEQWRTYTITEEPKVQQQNALGVDMIGPSGAVVWNSPAIDIARRQVYFGTGENMTSPATTTSDALFALDMDNGAVKWVFQATANDAWNTACDTDTPQNCPAENGPDFDFGAASMLVSTAAGELVIGGQKSGVVHALNPDTGELVWQTRVGRGGIQGGVHFGMAAADGHLYIPISDMADGRTYPDPAAPGMHALDAATGKILWSTLHEDMCAGKVRCHSGISQVPTVIGDVVVAGAMDGILRAYDRTRGTIRWQLDSTRSFDTVLGDTTRGGSFGGAAGPVAHQGLLLISSGYGIYNHMEGNLLLALELPAAEPQ